MIGLGDQDGLILQTLSGRGGQQAGIAGASLRRQNLLFAKLRRVLQVLRSAKAIPTLTARAHLPCHPLVWGLNHFRRLRFHWHMKRGSCRGQKDVAPKVRELVLRPQGRGGALTRPRPLRPGRGPLLRCGQHCFQGRPRGLQKSTCGLHGCGERRHAALRREEGLHVVRRLLQVARGGIRRGSGCSVLLLVGAGPPHLSYHVGAICLNGLYSNQVRFHGFKRTVRTRLKYPRRFWGAGGRGLGQAAVVVLAAGLVCLAADRRGIDLLKKPPCRLILRLSHFLLNEGTRVAGPGCTWKGPVALAAVTGRHAVRPCRVRCHIQGLEIGAPAARRAHRTEPGASWARKGPAPERIAWGGRIHGEGLARQNFLVLNKLQVLCLYGVDGIVDVSMVLVVSGVDVEDQVSVFQ